MNDNNKEISISRIDDRFSRYPSTMSANWLDIIEVLFVEHSTGYSDKKYVPMFNGWTFIEGSNKHAENTIDCHILCLDFDGEMSIAEAKNIYSSLEHIGYTSWSHKTEEKDGADCFRMVFPLAQPITRDDYYTKTDALKVFVSEADASCVAVARFFNLPACSADNQKHSDVWLNEGVFLDLHQFDDNPTYEPPATEYSPPDDADKAKMVEQLSNTFFAKEETWYKVASAMAANDFTSDDFIRVSTTGPNAQWGTTTREAQNKWKSAQSAVTRRGGIHYGFLVNLVKNGDRR